MQPPTHVSELEHPGDLDLPGLEKQLRNGNKSVLHTQLKKTKFCIYNMKQLCQYGDACAFAHSGDELQEPPNLKKTKLCMRFMETNRCTERDCPFAHGEDELRSTDMFYKKTLCMWHEKGKCRNGDGCRFAHGLGELVESNGGVLPRDMSSAASEISTLEEGGGRSGFKGKGSAVGFGGKAKGKGKDSYCAMPAGGKAGRKGKVGQSRGKGNYDDSRFRGWASDAVANTEPMKVTPGRTMFSPVEKVFSALGQDAPEDEDPEVISLQAFANMYPYNAPGVGFDYTGFGCFDQAAYGARWPMMDPRMLAWQQEFATQYPLAAVLQEGVQDCQPYLMSSGDESNEVCDGAADVASNSSG